MANIWGDGPRGGIFGARIDPRLVAELRYRAEQWRKENIAGPPAPTRWETPVEVQGRGQEPSFDEQAANLHPSKIPPREMPQSFDETLTGTIGDVVYGAPVIGPAALGLGARIGAAGQALQGKQGYSQALEDIQTKQENYRRLNPLISGSAQAGGSSIFSPAFGSSMGAQVVGNAALGGLDAMARGQDPTAAGVAAGGIAGATHLPAIFAGMAAKTANREMLTLANDLENGGFTPEEIWKKTGWFKGTDDKWRFEISDADASFNEPIALGGSDEVVPLGERLQHERAYEAYPDLKDIRSNIEMWEGGGGGMYGLDDTGQEALVASGRDPLSLKKTALHELQHAIQAREGFARGGNPNALVEDALAARKRWEDVEKPQAEKILDAEEGLYSEWLDNERINQGMPHGKAQVDAFRARYAQQFPENAARRNAAMDVLTKGPPKSRDIYERLAGETEARNVSTRSQWADKFRRADPPWTTQDVPGEQQIVRFRGLGDRLQSSVPDYRGTHTAPGRKDSAPLHDLTQLYPDDIYSSQAAQFYGHAGKGDPIDEETARLLRRFRGKPDAEVTVYRAIPKDAPDTLNPGDWVTINRNYARGHGEGPLQGDYKIVSQKVRASDLFTDANSMHEFGYAPEEAQAAQKKKGR